MSDETKPPETDQAGPEVEAAEAETAEAAERTSEADAALVSDPPAHAQTDTSDPDPAPAHETDKQPEEQNGGEGLASYDQAKAGLDAIVAEVRKKDVSLKRSLDLLEEGVRLANRCTELIDQASWDESAAETDA
jgi:exodeoxyribonuclease VII small subunit